MPQPIRHPVVNGEKYCADCYQTKIVKKFSVASKKYGTLKAICRKCESDKCNRRNAELRMFKRPDYYNECDDCGKIYYKTKNHICKGDEQ